MCIFFFIALALAAKAAGVSPDCTEYCESLSLEHPWSQWCDCSSEKLKPTSEFPILPTQLDETDIYYEPDETFTLQTKVLLQQPFLIKKTTTEQKFKTPKREVKNEHTLEVTENPHVEIKNTIISHERPLYLDIIIEDGITTRDADEIEKIKDIELTENSLTECLDLHIVVFMRKGANMTVPIQLIQPETIEIYKFMSDAELFNAIEKKCRQPLEVVNRSLQKILKTQHKKKEQSLNKSQLLHSYLNSRRDATASFEMQSAISEEEKSNPHHVTFSVNNAQMDKEMTTSQTIMDLERSPIKHNKTLFDNTTSESKLVSTQSTLGSMNTGIFNMPVSRSREMIKSKNSYEETSTDNVISSTYSEITDTDMTTEYTDTLTVVNDNIDSATADMNFIEDTNSNRDYNQTQQNISDSVNITEEADVEYYSSQDGTTSELNAESTINEESTTGSITQSTVLTNANYDVSQSFDTARKNISSNDNKVGTSNDVTRKVHERRKKYKESEISIPQIFTKELANGSAISTIQGYEILPNGDFAVDIDDNESSSTAMNAEFTSRRSSDPDLNHVSHYYPTGINGKIYFVFDRALIPGRFLQTSDGFLSLGVDGNSMCQNILKSNTSQFLLKLCKALISDNKYVNSFNNVNNNT